MPLKTRSEAGWSTCEGLESRKPGKENMTRTEFWSAVMGLLVAIVVMFNQMNGRLDTLNARIDTLQVKNQRQHDALQEQINRRFDTMQAENRRQHDAIEEVLRIFEGRIRASKKKPVLAPKTPNDELLGPVYRRGPAASPASSR